MYVRNISSNIEEALLDTPVIVINGARQVGKSTFIESLIKNGHEASYVTLDDSTYLSAALKDPEAFLQAFSGKTAIDEIQRAPGLLLPIKRLVDRERRSGQYILTGSANVLVLPKLSDSLAGRMEINTLWPLSQGEIRSHKETFVDRVFAEQLPTETPFIAWEDICDLLVKGGYPEALERQSQKRRKKWFKSYVTSLLQRDIRDLAHIEGLTEIPNLLALLANRSANLLNFSTLAQSAGIPTTTLKRYISLLSTIFLVVFLPPWCKNQSKRLVKSPKVYLNDSGLLCALREVNQETLIKARSAAGPILENFVVMEMLKQITWSELQPELYHFRTQAGQEVDIVLELPHGRLVGIEVKSSSMVNHNDFKGLKALAESAGDNFYRGIILYTGENAVTFGPNLHAIPLAALWEW